MGGLHDIEKHVWHIFGQVTDFRGEPIRGAHVHIDLGYGMTYFRDVQADVQGRFKTQYELEYTTFKTITAKLSVAREGYHPAREIVDFGNGDKTWEIKITMREETGDTEELGEESLVKGLGQKLRASLEGNPTLASGRKELARGAEQLLDRRDPVMAVEALDHAVKKYPDCADCRMLLGLARLDAGGLNGAAREFSEAAKSAEAHGDNLQRARVNLIFGVLEDWKGEYDKAAGFLMQAREQVSNDPLILRELGRTLIFQKNWEAADEYLGQALRAGAPKETMLLRARALLEEGDARDAAAQLKDYMGNRPAKDFPLPVHSLYTQILERLKVESSSKVASVLNQPPDTLVTTIPELRGIQAAVNQDELPLILKRTGEDVQAFFQNFSNTISEEQVREARLGKKGETKDSLQEKFQYLLLAKPEKWGVGLEEYRTDKNGDRTASKGLDAGLMLTSGFASASLVFHPSYQSGATFRLLGQQAVAGHHCYVVAFAQRPEKAQMVERFNTDQESILVLSQGLAWIDTSTYKVVRLRSDLLAPQPKIRLERQTTEIAYEPVQFKQLAAAMWLPSEVAVTVQWKGRTFRNTHTYSRFKLFNTEVKDKIRGTEPPPPTPPL
jgi:tetratricopeptide (TPR) repeat protein